LVTAFSGVTNFNSPESANRRLANAAFLQERDLPLFNHMVMEIRRLSHADERIPLPDPVEAGAWPRAFAVYEKLRDRAVVEEHRAVQHNQAFAADQREWSDYIQDRESILAGLRADVFDEHTLFEHLGLQKHDLGPPTTPETNKYGSNRHPDWYERAKRLSSALRAWHALSGEEKRTLRQMRIVRKIEAAKQERYV
jgi:hypothetical protein